MNPRRTRRARTNSSRGFATRRSRRLAHLDPTERDAIESHRRPSPLAANSTNGEVHDHPYKMEMVIRPLSAIKPGVVMHPPVVVALKTPTSRSERDIAYRDIGDVSGLWAFVSLVTEDQSQSLAPPRTDLLLGGIVGSIHPVFDDSNPEEPTVGYAIFPDLAITEPGTYCLRISLIDMDSNGSMLGEPMQSGTNLETVHSTIVHVAPEVEQVQPDPVDLQTLTRLREQGIMA